jgi:hypothetical protein
MCVAGTVLWSISKSALDPRILRGNLAATRRRAFFPLFLPSGVGIREMEKFWHELQFNPVAPVEVPFKAELFRRPPRSVQVLRRLSRKGREHVERTTRKLEGRPKLVLGLPNDAQDVAQLVALAHGDVGGVHSAPSGGQSNSDAISSTAAIHPPAEPRVSGGIRGRVGSDVELANIVPESQGATLSPMVPGTASSITIDTGDQPSQIKGPTGRLQVAPFPTGDSDDFIPKITLTRLEEMLSEDQRRIVEDQERLSAGACSSLTRPTHHRPEAAERSKSDQLIKNLRRCLRDADKIDRPGPVAQEDRRHAAEGTVH